MSLSLWQELSMLVFINESCCRRRLHRSIWLALQLQYTFYFINNINSKVEVRRWFRSIIFRMLEKGKYCKNIDYRYLGNKYVFDT